MSRTETFACAGCTRRFLTASARRRHYEWNPDHAGPSPRVDGENEPATGAETRPAPDAEASAREDDPVGDRWVEFEDRFETFLTFDGSREERVALEYRPGEGAVVVEQPEERRIDVSAVRSVATERVRWAFDGTFLTLTVPKSAGEGAT